MLPEEWPVTALPPNRSEPVRRAGRGRLPTVRRDLFLDDKDRLTEQERAVMIAMLDCLVAEIAGELEAALPAGWAGANDGDYRALADNLKSSGLLDDPVLVALLLRKAEEERVALAVRTRANRRDSRVLQSLVSHDNGPMAAAAMALVLARGRRRDRLGQCLVMADDLAPETLRLLASIIAAALRGALTGSHGAGAADQALGSACDSLLKRHDPERGVDALTRELVALIDSAGRLDDNLLVAAGAEGEISFLAHALARRAGIDPAVAADELASGDPLRAMALLRMGGASRDLAAGLLAGSGDWIALDDEGAAIESFDHLSAADVETARSWLLADDRYRSAVERLGGGNG